jgi:phosphoenolpyruvate carboxykinase (ATP)
LLVNKLKEHHVNVWLVNTGWTGGPYGVGKRMKLQYTRAMITAAISGQLDHVHYKKHPIFNLNIPVNCPNVPDNILNPRNTWADKYSYDEKANNLAMAFIKNFEQYVNDSNSDIINAGPRVTIAV